MLQAHLAAVLGAIALFLLTLACFEAGYRVGQRRSEHWEAAHKGLGTIETAIFGLLGLLLGFSFAAGLSNLENRRHLIVGEANAAGTAYARIDLLAAKDQPELRQLFRDYLDARLRLYQKLPNARAVEEEFTRAAGIQRRIWAAAVSATRAAPSPTAGMLLLPALNEMFDIATSRKVALYTHVPVLILGLLTSIALLSALLAGYAMAERWRRSWLHMVMYALVICMTIYAVFDLDHPRGGFIRLDAADAALKEVRNSMR